MGRDLRQTDPKRHTMTAPPKEIPGLDGRSPPPPAQLTDKPRDRAGTGVSVTRRDRPASCTDRTCTGRGRGQINAMTKGRVAQCFNAI